MDCEYVCVAENEKHETAQCDFDERKKQREEKEKKMEQKMENMNKRIEKLEAKDEMQEKREELERKAEAERKNQEQIAANQMEKDRLATELAKKKKAEHHGETSTKMQYQEHAYSQSDYDTLKKTVYGHANREPREAQMGVAFVVVNRLRAHQVHWGTSIDEVCRRKGQFWIGIFGEPEIHDLNMYNSIDEWLPNLLKGEIPDLTNGANHFLPHSETDHDWLSIVTQVASLGNFNFFKANWLP